MVAILKRAVGWVIGLLALSACSPSTGILKPLKESDRDRLNLMIPTLRQVQKVDSVWKFVNTLQLVHSSMNHRIKTETVIAADLIIDNNGDLQGFLFADTSNAAAIALATVLFKASDFRARKDVDGVDAWYRLTIYLPIFKDKSSLKQATLVINHDSGNEVAESEDLPVGFVAPKVIDRFPAKYPLGAEASGLCADVVLNFVVDENGVPGSIAIHRPSGFANSGMDLEAVKSLLKYTFQPGTLNGTPVAVNMRLPIPFRLGAGCKLSNTIKN